MRIFSRQTTGGTAADLGASAKREAQRLGWRAKEAAAEAGREGGALARSLGREIVTAEDRAVAAIRAQPVRSLGIALIGLGLLLALAAPRRR